MVPRRDHSPVNSSVRTGERATGIPIAGDGWIFLGPAAGLLLLFLLLKMWWPALGAVLVFTALAFFFRDPERLIPSGTNLILSPADGRVVEVRPAEEAAGQAGDRISIFLSVFDVHVNRAPVAGEVKTIEYRPGRFHLAWKEEASRENEQNVIHLESSRGPVVVTQIAGTLARRIVCRLRPGQKVEAGERMGMIRFGSRVDIVLPPRAKVQVGVGERVAGGISIIAVMP